MKKRLLSALLCLCMMLTMTPAAFAVDGDDNNSDVSPQAVTSLPAAVDGVITLTEDVTLDTMFTIEENENIVLNLNGHILTLNGQGAVTDEAYQTNSAAGILNKGTLTVRNGQLKSNVAACMIINFGKLSLANDVSLSKSEAGNAIDNLGGTVVSDADITLNNTNYTAIVTYGGSVTINDGEIKADYGISIFNRSHDNESSGAEVVIEGGSITSKYFALSTNNITSGGENPCNATISSGTLTSTNATAVYWPSAGKLEIGTTGGDNEAVKISTEAGSAIEVCSGTLIINSGTLSGSDSSGSLNQSPNWAAQYRANSGCAGLGDAVTIIARRGSGYDTAPLNVAINGGNFTSSDNYAVRYFDCNEVSGATQIIQDVSVSISSGTFKFTGTTGGSAVDAEVVPESDQDFITGGTFSSNVENYVATGYACTQSGNNYVVDVAENGAMVVKPDAADDDSVSAELDGIYKDSNTEITTEGGLGTEEPSDTDVETTGEVTVDLTTSDGSAEESKTATLNVTQQAAKSLAAAPALTVKTDVGNVKLDATALKKVGDNLNGSVEISITKEETGESGDIAAAYTVEVKSGGKNLLPDGAANNGTVTITVDMPENTGNIQAWYAAKQDDNSWMYIEELTTTTVEDKVAIQIGHLSSIVLRTSAPSDEERAAASVTKEDGTETNYSTLQAAIDAAEADNTVTLLKDVALTEGVGVNRKLTLDLNGNTISASDSWSGSDYLVVVNRGGNLTIEDSSPDNSGAIKTDNQNIYAAVKLTLANDSGTDKATLTVNGGTLQGYYYGISGNGTRHGTDVTINGGTIIGTNGTGIYHPQDGILTIKGGELSGLNTAVELRSGTLNISGGTFTAKATEYKEEQNSSGTTVSGAAIAISQHTTKKDISVTISGGTFNGVYALSETNVQNSTETGDVKIVTISGGTFDGNVKSDDCNNFISGGNFSAPVSTEYLADTIKYEVKAGNSSTPYSYHSTVDKAMEAAGSNGTIKVIDKVTTETHTVTFDYNYDIDDYMVTVVNGDTITLPSPRRSGYDFEGW